MSRLVTACAVTESVWPNLESDNEELRREALPATSVPHRDEYLLCLDDICGCIQLHVALF